MIKTIIPILALGLIACSGSESAAPELKTDIESQIVSMADIAKDDADWGTFYPHFAGTTYGTNPTLAGIANINAGQQIHPPHRHGDEEFLLVTKGSGKWYLNGETFPAKEGDMLYSKPWDYHGIKADPGSDLQFVVFKWSSKGFSPVDPDPSLPEELPE